VGKVISVNASVEKGVVKKPVAKGYLAVAEGLRGDAHAADGRRQVSLLALESVDTIRALGMPDLGYGDFAENITTRGIVLHELPVGTRMRIGQAEAEVTQIGKECHQGCAIRRQVGDCVMPREGIFVRILSSGWVQAGDDIAVLS